MKQPKTKGYQVVHPFFIEIPLEEMKGDSVRSCDRLSCLNFMRQYPNKR
ncbi:hypothetical protein I8751_09720 [Nostocaceae cyanobacterium CENA357]|uniref:Uncharacterized protein n=1 Tax=Atlanticothrix silvestris CENA357 TaxID=1725252 RepID=A0A8J7L3J9_9CYAN|nr:hypothetical protein [Atlanticothrix silvestris]MBH8552647.1 hypothetical protein [Atlanticothrix silvestris CENA357]